MRKITKTNKAGKQTAKLAAPKPRFDPFTLVVALVLLFIASILVFPNISLSKKLLASGAAPVNYSNQTNSTPLLKSGLQAQSTPAGVELGAAPEQYAIAVACVADARKHAMADGTLTDGPANGMDGPDGIAHCLAEYQQEKASRNKAYGDDCETHDQCPPSIVWTEDAHHGECPAGTGFKCSVRCTSDNDCSFKTGGVLSSCCKECAAGQPFGFCTS